MHGMELLASRGETRERPLAFDALVSRYDADHIDLLGGRARIRLAADEAECDVVLEGDSAELGPARGTPDALLSASEADWRRLALDLRGGFKAFRSGGLSIRRNLHLGTGFLAATAAEKPAGALRFDSYRTAAGRFSVMEAGEGEPLLCLHGLGGTKASFMSTVAALAPRRRVIAADLLGFGDSDKPIRGRYDAPWFADSVTQLLDELGLERADVIGNSMGGRIAIELGLRAPERVRKIVLLSPAMAWLRHDRALSMLLRLPVPRLGLIQPTPRALVEPIVRRLVPDGGSGWVAAGLDEFLRAYCTPAGRVAFYESAANIFRDRPHGDEGFWRRLEGLSPETMFVWGREDTLVPLAFMKHVEKALPAARHVELDCGHVPQVEAPERTHAAVEKFLRG
jgi:pimeloyl-ACP methyl ester carboxylesterase